MSARTGRTCRCKRIGAVPFEVLDDKDPRAGQPNTVALDPDDEQYMRDLVADLRDTAKRDQMIKEAYTIGQEQDWAYVPLHQQAARLWAEAGDLQQAANNLERAVRMCPPGPELETVQLDLARVYGQAGRLKEQHRL